MEQLFSTINYKQNFTIFKVNILLFFSFKFIKIYWTPEIKKMHYFLNIKNNFDCETL